MSAAITTCASFECDGCGNGWDDEEGVPHFPLVDATRVDVQQAAQVEDQLVEQNGWTVVAGQHFCRTCSAARYCAEHGHEWGPWQAAYDYAVPNWAANPVGEQRFCERDFHCHEREVRR